MCFDTQFVSPEQEPRGWGVPVKLLLFLEDKVLCTALLSDCAFTQGLWACHKSEQRLYLTVQNTWISVIYWRLKGNFESTRTIQSVYGDVA